MLDLSWENLDQAFDALEAECAAVVRGITVEAWNRVLHQTPQFYGRAVASWTYTIGTPVFVDRSGDVWHGQDWRTEETPLGKGNPTAIGVANAANMGHQTSFKLGDTVWFANGVNHGEGPYAMALESPSIHLRSANRPGQMVKRAMDFIQSKYGDDVKPASASRLKGLSIGF